MEEEMLSMLLASLIRKALKVQKRNHETGKPQNIKKIQLPMGCCSKD